MVHMHSTLNFLYWNQTIIDEIYELALYPYSLSKSGPFSLQAKLTLVCEKKKPSDGLIYVLHKLVNDL